LCSQKKCFRNAGSRRYIATYHGTFTATTTAMNHR
jgi:hypothetical protein